MAGGERRHATRSDCAAAVIPPIQSKAPWRIVDMALIGERAMHVRFVDGVEGVVRFGPNFYRGVFAHLVDAERFAEARVEMGGVTWPGELDLAPDRMHDDIVALGECILGAESI
jgi:hypothetical protein